MTKENNTPDHFEQVWEKSEFLASEKFKSSTYEQIMAQIIEELNSYKSYETTELSANSQYLLKIRHMGTILYLLSALSHRDNLNVWASLKGEILFEEMERSKAKDEVLEEKMIHSI
jgi:hypothetical protein